MPACRAGSMSSGAGIVVNVVDLRSLRATTTSPPQPPFGTVNETYETPLTERSIAGLTAGLARSCGAE